MVARAETISQSQFRRRFLRSGLRGFRAEINEQRSLITDHYENAEVGSEKLEANGIAALPCSSNSYLLTSDSSLSYDYKRLLCETDTIGGAISQTYASDTTEEFGDLIGEDGQYIHQYDAQANTNALLDESGTVQAQYKYFAFGQVSAVSIDGGPWTAEDWESLPLDFTSNMLAGGKKQYYLDQEIALYLLGSGNNGRYYDAAAGRFLSEDPTKQDGASKDSNSQLLAPNSSADINLYCYTGNDPINNLDPSGHDSKKDPPKQVYHPPQTQPAQQHNAVPPPASVGNNDNTTWLAELQGKPAGTPVASLIAPSQSTAGGGEVGKYLESGTAALAQHPSALGPGSLQGLANTLNTVENAADSVVNSAIAGNNLLNMGANKIAGLVDHGAAPFGMVPSIPTSNWSKGAFVSHDPARPVEKAVTGTAIAVATTFGGGAAEDAAPALAAASDAAKGLMGKVSAIAEKVGGWIKGLIGKTAEEGGAAGNAGLRARFRQGPQGQLSSAFAKVEPKDIGTGSTTTPASRSLAKRLGNATDEAGHAIGKNLGGPGGATSGNIFPRVPSVNRGAFAQFEQQIARRVEAGDEVYVRVVPRYAPGATRPYGIAYQVRINGATTTRVFTNR